MKIRDDLLTKLKDTIQSREQLYSPKAMHLEMSDEPIVAMKVKPVKYRTCIAGCRGRIYEDKT